ncbi:uncharacterized protein FFB20_10325 [Fusarium fujikuroi]|uniref:Uncharacterized protein n=2 Tax=Fusarium fujikuroi TaxID=5127 RepID=S0EP22_GIBF5|nr:uncharacterized protein FFUJ_12035 [Fusarium fujikuroi IMI 58289]KLO90670.1 uncharacterized protein Y057_5087 [Fusarium fujikuroi]QGI71233.1 hypothetical protein CEK27_003562 [Fusarium fujikuroi]QGI88567.1 hypothetical protein CEK25_003523 [Fusarium fujikuroi]QGJ02126.1 hypothetical protein CEK26_003570 [Fusarium fujikuroi]CCT76079.1 uncharacterized protein FFUJ_12035 [Fusarium fujikuroi IMI 58289]
MPEPVEAETWSTKARSGSPRPTPPAVPSQAGKPSLKELKEKNTQEEVLLGFGAQFGSGKSKPASG